EQGSRTARSLVDTGARVLGVPERGWGKGKEGEMEGHTDAPCPNCDHPVNDKPRAGGVTVWLNCGAWLVPDGETKLRGMSRSEAERIPGPVQSTLIKASRLIL